MTHWGWYWKIKRSDYEPKQVCDFFSDTDTLDSFTFFRNPIGVKYVKESTDKISFIDYKHAVVAKLMENDNLHITIAGSLSYIIPVEKQPCNYGGLRYFFLCPKCYKRMRKLYSISGKYLCRKCHNLGYYSQRIRPTYRCLAMARKIKKYLQDRAGDIDRKPPWMKRTTFKALQWRHYEYYNGDKAMNASLKEFLQYYPHKRNEIDKIKEFFVL